MTDPTRAVDEREPTNASPDDQPSPADLVGRWQAAALRVDGRRRRVPARMVVTMDFKASGLLEVIAGSGETRHVRFGTYLVNGQKLIVNLEGYTEIMGFLVKEQRLTLKKSVSPPRGPLPQAPRGVSLLIRIWRTELPAQ